MRKIFWPKKEEVETGGNCMISSIFGLLIESYCGDQMKNKRGGKCSMYGDMKNVNMVLVGKSEGTTWKTSAEIGEHRS